MGVRHRLKVCATPPAAACPFGAPYLRISLCFYVKGESRRNSFPAAQMVIPFSELFI